MKLSPAISLVHSPRLPRPSLRHGLALLACGLGWFALAQLMLSVKAGL